MVTGEVKASRREVMDNNVQGVALPTLQENRHFMVVSNSFHGDKLS